MLQVLLNVQNENHIEFIFHKDVVYWEKNIFLNIGVIFLEIFSLFGNTPVLII